jgi:hypothetical protein
MILSTNLQLEDYLDIAIETKYDEVEDAIFTCSVDFNVTADINGLEYSIEIVKTPRIKYSANNSDDEEPLYFDVDLSDFNTSVFINKTDDEKYEVRLDNVDINIENKILKIYFIN